MNNLVNLNAFRKQRRQRYFQKNGKRLERFITQFIHNHLNTNFVAITERYISECANNQEMAWDYLDLRELLLHGLSEALGKKLEEEIGALWWYDRNIVPIDEILDRFLSAFILQNERAKIS